MLPRTLLPHHRSLQVQSADLRCYNQGTISDWLFLCFHSDGTGRTGTYILIDMVLNRMAKGAVDAG